MAESSPGPAEGFGDTVSGPPSSGFSRGRLIVGVVLVLAVGAGIAFAAARLRPGSSPGRVLYVSGGSVHAYDLGSGESEEIAGWPSGAGSAVADRDGRRLAYAQGDVVRVVDLRSGERTEAGTGRPVAFARDGSITIERPTPQGRTILVNVSEDGEERTIVPLGFAGPDGPPVWLSDELFAVRLTNRDGEGGALSLIQVGPDGANIEHVVGDARVLAASPDGAEMLVAHPSGDGERLEVFDVSDLQGRPLGPKGRFGAAAVSTDGVPAIAASLQDGGSGVFSFSAASDEAIELVEGDVTVLAWTLDGTHVVYATANGELHRTSADGQTRSLGIGTDAAWLAVVG